MAATASAVAALVLVGCAGTATDPESASVATPSAGPEEPSGATPIEERDVSPSPARRVGSVARRPREIRLPGTGWLPVDAVDTRRNGVLDVPADVDRLGWWQGGSRVGDPFGAVLVAGHVDSETQGLGPSAVLLEVAGGDEVRVRSGGGGGRRVRS